MNATENFVIPKIKTELDVFKEIVFFVVAYTGCMTFIFATMVNMNDLLAVELFPFFLVLVGIFAVYQVISKNRVIPDEVVDQLIQDCSKFPSLERNILLTLNQNKLIRKSDLSKIRSVAFDELQLLRAVHQTSLLPESIASGDPETALKEQKIEDYGRAIKSLTLVLKSS